MISSLFYILCIHVYIIKIIESKSVCAEIDIVCFIDSATIKHSTNDILQFIDNLVLKGSNEETSISIIVYGEIAKPMFKNEKDIILINSDETINIKKGRKRKQAFIRNKLNFKQFLNDNAANSKYVSLSKAIDIVNPSNDQQLIVFEYDENIVTNDENCDLISQYMDNIHFIINKDYNKKGNFLNCPGMKLIKKEKERRLVYYFNQIQENMELIYDVSCPTPLIQVNDDNDENIGNLALNKHSNYLNIDAIINCDLYYGDDGELTTNSTITVVDDLEDDMTFEMNEYLIIKQIDYKYVASDCRYPIFKINNVETQTNDPNSNILVLYVTTPAIFEYIPELHIKARKVKTQKLHSKRKGKYRYKRGDGAINNKNKKNVKRKLLGDAEELHANNGMEWGEWDTTFDINNPICDGAPVYCFNLKVDPDGSGANAIRLLCANGNIDKRSNDGPWGSYMLHTLCCPNNNNDASLNNFLSGFRQRVEPSQGWWDDSAINDVQFKCSDGTILTSTNGATEGSWSSWNNCGSDKYIGSYNQRVEQDQGMGDDTGLNDMKFYCYPKDSNKIYYGSSDVNAGMFEGEEPEEVFSIDTGLIEFPLPKWVSGSDPLTEGDVTQGDDPKKYVVKVMGSLEVTASFELSLSLSADLDFDYSASIWDGFSINEIKMIFYGNYYVMATVGIDIRAWIQIMIPKLFYQDKILIFWFGFVPVVISPYIQIDLFFQSPKVGITASYTYSYKSTDFSFGITYTSIDGWETINSFPNNEKISTCNVDLVNEFETNICDMSITVNGGLNIFVGVKLYEVVKAFLMINLNSKNVLALPTVCSDDSVNDICQQQIMKATVNTKNTITISVGAGLTDLALKYLPESMVSALKGGVLLLAIPGLEGIIIYQNEWCFNLDGILSSLNDLFKTACCAPSAHSKLKPLAIGYDGFINNNNNNNIDNFNDLMKQNKYIIPTIFIVFMIVIINATCMILSYWKRRYPTQYNKVSTINV